MWNCLYCRGKLPAGKKLWHDACESELRSRRNRYVCVMCGTGHIAPGGWWCYQCIHTGNNAYLGYPGGGKVRRRATARQGVELNG